MYLEKTVRNSANGQNGWNWRVCREKDTHTPLPSRPCSPEMVCQKAEPTWLPYCVGSIFNAPGGGEGAFVEERCVRIGRPGDGSREQKKYQISFHDRIAVGCLVFFSRQEAVKTHNLTHVGQKSRVVVCRSRKQEISSDRLRKERKRVSNANRRLAR